MVRGLYTATAGALVAQSWVDNVANNLANVTTGGFKQKVLQIQNAPTLDIYRVQNDPGPAPNQGVPVSPYVGALGTGSAVYDTPNSFEAGPLQATGNALDVALTGQNGFFAVQTAQGVRYTRDGEFVRAANGTLENADGDAVLSQNGAPIVINDQGDVTVSADGTISQAGQSVGQLQIVGFGNLTALRAEGANLFADTGAAAPQGATGTSVQQGFLEKSNANVVRSMVDLITAERWFDANEKVIKTQDDATNLAITQVAKTQ